MSKRDKEYREIRKEVNKAAKDISNAEVRMQNVQDKMSRRPRPKKERAAAKEDNGEVYTAPLGIANIVIEWHTKEGVQVQVDEFPLRIDLGNSRILPALVKALSRKGPDDGGQNGPFVPLKTADEIIRDIQTQIEVKITKESLRTHLWLLRDYLVEASLDRDLVKTVMGRNGGVRMLLSYKGKVHDIKVEDK